KYDKQGKHTHGVLNSHDFAPFDFCLKCKQPKFDHGGFLTHPSIYDLNDSHLQDHHEFESAIAAKTNSKRRKISFAISGITAIVISANVSLTNLF
ncbi:MAG: hypothetical protein PVI88_06790, partial [Nitrosopumilaceae archaeon]